MRVILTGPAVLSADTGQTLPQRAYIIKGSDTQRSIIPILQITDLTKVTEQFSGKAEARPPHSYSDPLSIGPSCWPTDDDALSTKDVVSMNLDGTNPWQAVEPRSFVPIILNESLPHTAQQMQHFAHDTGHLSNNSTAFGLPSPLPCILCSHSHQCKECVKCCHSALVALVWKD